MAAPPPPHPAVLMDDLVEEFLLRLPPEDPAGLARAALVSRQWHRVITGPVFRRRFREFHRSAPLLGYIVNLHTSIRFVPMSSFRPPHAVRRDVRAIHSSRGRVLLQRSVGGGLNVIRHFGGYQEHLDFHLSVWDPITDEQRDLPVVPCPLTTSFWDAAVVCEDCNHLHCNFKVVFMGRTEERMIFSCFYSSEAGGWSDPIFASGEDYGQFVRGTSVLVGRALYFKCGRSHEIVKYELLTHQMCRIGVQRGGTLIAAEDGRVGVAMAWDSTLRLLRREHGGWEESRAIELHTLLPDDAMCEIEAFGSRPFVAGFAEIGAGIIFLRTCVGYFIIDLNSGRTKKLGKYLRWHGRIVPYVSFCTPVFKDEGPGAGVAVSIDKVPGVAVAICRDEGLGAAVAVSTDEVPGAAVGVSTDEGLETGTVSSA